MADMPPETMLINAHGIKQRTKQAIKQKQLHTTPARTGQAVYISGLNAMGARAESQPTVWPVCAVEKS